MKLALKITPQRSTQYAHMTAALAAPELLASPLGPAIQDVQPIKLAGQEYLLLTADDTLITTSFAQHVFSLLGATSGVYEYFDQIASVPGPLLRPVEPLFTPFVPLEMAEARRYKGKTNETFTRVLLNVALFAGDYAERVGERLRVLDPLSGGGTTLFLALAYGYDAFGIEQGRQDVESTAVFVRQFLQGERISYKEIDEKGRRAGRRYQFEVGRKGDIRHCVLVHGNSVEAQTHLREVVGGPRVHAVVGDLPYGIQHFAEIEALFREALPVWEQLLFPGGTIALSWNATRIAREEMVGLLRLHTGLQVLDEPPYTQLGHAVDRVIKRRDIIVGVKR
ncbi:MAG TPA: hypothetical protein VL461_01325 [Dictyobacter sp.]|jgi:hypothetical protein|nr:hypothetical protein [Dictyobacter sp.]